MLDDITIRFSGEQGSGVQYTGRLAARYFTKTGYHVFAINDFESRIRGGYSFTQLRIGLAPAFSMKKSPDIVIPFSKSVIEKDIKTLSPETCLFLSKDFLSDSLSDYKKYIIDSKEVLKKEQLSFNNTFFVALLAGIFNADLNILKETLKSVLVKKGTDIINNNCDVADKGYKYGKKPDMDSFSMKKPDNSHSQAKALSGSFVLSAGAAVSNCKFYAAYPMSPSTSIINHLSDWSQDFGIITEQGEDEIAVLNLALGASYAGVRTMIGTSGGDLP